MHRHTRLKATHRLKQMSHGYERNLMDEETKRLVHLRCDATLQRPSNTDNTERPSIYSAYKVLTQYPAPVPPGHACIGPRGASCRGARPSLGGGGAGTGTRGTGCVRGRCASAPGGGGGPPSSWEPRSTTIDTVVSRKELKEEKKTIRVRCIIISYRKKILRLISRC